MRVLWVSIVALIGALVTSCHGGGEPSSTPDAGDAPDDTRVRDDTGSPDYPPEDAAKTINCKLWDGSDPVGLCIQKTFLLNVHEAGLLPGVGVARSWDSTTSVVEKDAGGTPLHDARDDVGFGASIARYWLRARTYGDNEITAILVADLRALSPIVEKELATPPDDYSGELYFDLRTMAGGLRYVNENARADAIDKVADAYGRAIYDRHVRVRKTDGGKPTDAVLGDASGTETTYLAASVASGALALADLAVRHATDGEKNATLWQQAARLAFDHLWTRARDDKTGLFFRALTTSDAAIHDTVPVGDDALLAEVQGATALAMMRAQALADKSAAALPAFADAKLETKVGTLLIALNAPALGLWDSGAKGYFEGWNPSTSTRIARKSTRANALLLATLHRALLSTLPISFNDERKALRARFLTRTPLHSGFISVIPDQVGLFVTVPPTFSFETDAGVPFARTYWTAMTTAVSDALDEQWLGRPD